MAIAPQCSLGLPSEMAEAAESISFEYLTTVLTECEEISIYFEEESKEIEETFLSSCKKCERRSTTKAGLKRHLSVQKGRRGRGYVIDSRKGNEFGRGG